MAYTRSLRTSLILAVFPVIVISILVVTALSGFSAWYSGKRAMTAWTSLVRTFGPQLLQDEKDSLELRASMIVDPTEAPQRDALAASEIYLPSPASCADSSDWVKGAVSSWTDAEETDLQEDDEPGFRIIGNALVYVSYNEAGEIFASKLDDVLEKLKEVTQAEAMLLEPDGRVLNATFLDTSGRKLIPVLGQDAGGREQMAAHAAQKSLWKVTFELPRYQGFTDNAGRRVKAGADRLEAFVSLFPIAGYDGHTVAYLGIAAPADAILSGPRKGILGSIACGVLLSILACWILVYKSGQISMPLSEITGRIEELSSRLARERSLTIPPASEFGAGTKCKEIRELTGALFTYERIFEMALKMKRMLEDEREKSFSAAKLAALGEMAGGIAHEINSPLAAISTRAGQLLEILGDETLDRALLKEMASEIESTSFRIAKIVSGMRSFIRDASHDPFVPTPVAKIVDETLAICTEKFKHHQIDLLIESVSSDVQIACRPSEIAQALLNLLNNARDAVEGLEERWIRIAVRPLGPNVEITVTDSGSGIPPETASKFFQPFFTTKPVGKGTGLGLGISRGIAERHGGSLTFDTRSTHTRFTLLIPKITA